MNNYENLIMEILNGDTPQEKYHYLQALIKERKDLTEIVSLAIESQEWNNKFNDELLKVRETYFFKNPNYK